MLRVFPLIKLPIIFSFNRPFHVFLFTCAKLRMFPLIKLPMIFNRQFHVRFFTCVSTNQVNFYVLMFH